MYRFLRIPQLFRVQNRAAFVLFLAAGVAAMVTAPRAQSQVITHGENPVLSATVTSVETSPGANGWRYVTTSVHLHNLTKQPLVLGVEPGKVNVTDNQHNIYGVIAVRGIGTIAGPRVDTKFVLPPEGGGDALFEMRGRGDRNTIYGTTFDLTLPVRVILPLEGGQYKLSTEHLMTFSGLKAGHVATPKGAPSLPENTVNAGPFTVQITRLKPSVSGNRRHHIATLAARVQNTSAKPIVLAYEGSSSYGIDDQGNRYGTAGDTSVSGIGIVTSIGADPQFTLAPGESRDVQFTVLRSLGREEAGKQLTYYVALAQLEVLPSKQIRTVRQYSLTFPRIPGLN
ncbi:MAG: hypothetical protein JWL77_425 [Chthonomonadaceae bacterium]|nr:hypothetical protein [Chthonomonadaceae bacterium]